MTASIAHLDSSNRSPAQSYVNSADKASTPTPSKSSRATRAAALQPHPRVPPPWLTEQQVRRRHLRLRRALRLLRRYPPPLVRLQLKSRRPPAFPVRPSAAGDDVDDVVCLLQRTLRRNRSARVHRPTFPLRAAPARNRRIHRLRRRQHLARGRTWRRPRGPRRCQRRNHPPRLQFPVVDRGLVVTRARAMPVLSEAAARTS